MTNFIDIQSNNAKILSIVKGLQLAAVHTFLKVIMEVDLLHTHHLLANLASGSELIPMEHEVHCLLRFILLMML